MNETLKGFLDNNPTAKICILDNNSVEFLNRLKMDNVYTTLIFNKYDAIIIPYWVLQEIKDSEFRNDFIQNFEKDDIKVYKVSEIEYIDLVCGEELNLLKIVLSSVRMFQKIESHIRKTFIKSKNLEDIQYEYKEWIDKLYIDWPIQGKFIEKSSRIQKKNAGEISITILANILSYYYPELKSITLITFDKDCYDCVNKSKECLSKDINFKNKRNSNITFKSNDFIIFELVKEGYYSIDKIKSILDFRCARKIKYNCKRSDGSIQEFHERIDNAKLFEIIEDNSIYIIF